jgi:hypothetical protein
VVCEVLKGARRTLGIAQKGKDTFQSFAAGTSTLLAKALA